MSEVHWHGDAAIDYVRTRAMKLVEQAAITVERRAKELISIPGTAYTLGKRGGRGSKRITGAVRSKPGEPPRKQTGRLRASVTREVARVLLAARVGTNVVYGRHLELGTKRGLLPRPWLRRALDEMRSKVDSFLSQLGGG